ncbi:chloramphenicol phosphotransferase [Rhizobium sp. ZK1]|uniref:chloramphenicol phosphotransferase n=1 Tax=Rhizobium sp. ZK1 TaxID=3389872 RepID=UPI0039F6BCA4
MTGIFLLLIGFPGTGKLTIASKLAPHYRAKIIDNHWVNNPVMGVLDHDLTKPLPSEIWEQTGRVRQTVLDTIVAFSAPSANFIFTHAGIHGDERSHRTFRQIADAAGQRGSLLVPVRLLCETEELSRRVAMPERRERLKSVNAEASKERSRTLQVLDPEHANTLNLDVTAMSAEEGAEAIRRHVSVVSSRAGGPAS